ncbi:tetratricopeptide repeat protein [Streptomyces sp. CA-294286]|uniref:tetratricopeptide repeat protein n=1 Tax=Streptomyces sp. CA-294286 TaxID=3240070 RepID=UPI003D8D4230
MPAVAVAVLAAGSLVLLAWDADGGRPAAKPAAGAPGVATSLAALNARVRASPRDDGAWTALGAALVERGARAADATYYPKAETALRRSLTLRAAGKGNVAAMVGMARLSHARGDFATARRWGETARRQAPKEWTAYPVLIDAYGRLGDAKAAGRTAEELLGRRGGATALGWTAQTYRNKGWREDAAALAGEAVATAETSAEKAEQLNRAGELAWERGDLKDALGYFDASLSLDRRQGTALAGRARVLAGAGRTAEAAKAYRAALTLAPRPEYAVELGELTEAGGGNGDSQYRWARTRIAHDGRQGVRGDLALGRLESDHGDAETAVELLRAEFARHPGPEAADALAWALHRTGDDEAAWEYARKATKEGARNAMFLYHRGEIERATGDYGAARRHLAEALRVNPVFSPLWAPHARASLARLGEPPEGGPRQLWEPRPRKPAPRASAPRPRTQSPAGTAPRKRE